MQIMLKLLSAIAVIAGIVFASHSVRAKPVEYVKVCDAYGAGFYYIPGTDTCIRIGGYVQAGWGWGESDYSVTPGFSYNASGGVFGAGGQVLFRNPASPLIFGAEFTWSGNTVSGSSIYVGNGLEHKTKLEGDAALEAFFGMDVHELKFGRGYTPPAPAASPIIGVTFGPMWGRTKVSAEGIPGSSTWQTGYTVGGLYEQPVNNGWSVGVKVQYINFGRDEFNLGGPVDVKSDEWRAVIRIQRNFMP